MLIVKTKLKFSELHGLGVFADEPISRGRVVLRYNQYFDLFFSDEDIKKLPKPMVETLEYYGTRCNNPGGFYYFVDNERFLNHSDNPNLRIGRVVMTAARDVKAGEELTVDYRQFCADCASQGLNSIFRLGRRFTEDDPLREE